MPKILVQLFVGLLFLSHTDAQSKSHFLVETSPAAGGFSAERLQRVDKFIQKYIDDKQMNGAVTLIAHDGKIVYYKAAGYNNIEQKVPMRTDNIFRIASMTKPIISVAVMMLFDEGKISLDDAVSKYIPEFKNAQVLDKYNEVDTTYTTVPAKREITIRHLLSHTSGIGYAQIGSDQANAIYYKNKINGGIGTPNSSLKEIIPRLARLPLFHQPGEKFLYGNNTDVLGYLVEVVSGMPLDKFLTEKIFIPLGMKDTYFFIPKEKQNRLVPLYKQNSEGHLQSQDSLISLNGTFYRDFPIYRGTYFSGGAGLCSTAYDYARFGQMLLNGGELEGKRILSSHTIRMMTSNQIGNYLMWNDTKNIRRFGLGLGIYTEYAAATTGVNEGSVGWEGMFASHFWADPKEKLVVVVMRNVWPTNHWDLGDRIKAVVYGALE